MKHCTVNEDNAYRHFGDQNHATLLSKPFVYWEEEFHVLATSDKPDKPFVAVSQMEANVHQEIIKSKWYRICIDIM